MLLRPKLAGLLVTFMASAALLFSGCSSSQPRDINYGTDVGLGYVPASATSTATEAGASEAGGSAVSGSADGADDAGISVDSVADVNAAADAGVSVDASIDGAT
jgi:hypothetical protein